MVERDVIHKQNLRDYFDGVGFERWAAIYGGDESLSFVRRMVQDGHAMMLEQACAWLAENPSIETVFDAGCGTGLFSIAMAEQGKQVTAMDISPRMVELAAADARAADVQEKIAFSAGDIQTIEQTFDAVACFDVLVHYPRELFAELCTHLARCSEQTLVFTYAPYRPLLAFLHWVGGHFPRGNRRTEIQMIRDEVVTQALAMANLHITRTHTIRHGFYHVELVQAVRT